MNNRTQQRLDRSIREAITLAANANDEKPRRDVRGTVPEEVRATGRTQLMRDLSGATVLVPWAHPEAVAWRARRE